MLKLLDSILEFSGEIGGLVEDSISTRDKTMVFYCDFWSRRKSVV